MTTSLASHNTINKFFNNHTDHGITGDLDIVTNVLLFENTRQLETLWCYET